MNDDIVHDAVHDDDDDAVHDVHDAAEEDHDGGVLTRPGVEVECTGQGKVPNRLRQSAAGMIWFGDLCDASFIISCPSVVVVPPVGVVVPPVLLVGSDRTDVCCCCFHPKHDGDKNDK